MMNAGLGAIAPRNPNPMAPQPQPFQQLLDLNKAVKAANLQRAAQGQQAMAQAAQRPPTVKEELEMALRQAMPQQPAYAGGGAVAFEDGGLTEADLEGLDEDMAAEGATSQEAQDRQSILSALSSMGMTAEKLAAAGYDVFTMPVRALAGVYNTLARGPRAFGVPLPFIPEAFGQNSLTPAMDRITARENQDGVVQAYQDPNRPPTLAAPAGLAAAAATPSAGSAPAARSAGAGTARPAGAGAGLGAVAPQYDELTQLRRMYEQMAKDVEGTAAVDPRVLEARQAYDSVLKASMDPAEQQLRELEAQQSQNFFENPELMAAMLEGMKGSERLGETLFGAATGLVKARAGQKRERREAQANIIKLRQELAKAEAEARLARAEKDTEGERRAKLKAAEIRAAMDEKTYELKTKRISADASATAAANRPTAEQRGQLTQEDLARIYGQVSKELRGNDAIKAQVIRARVQAGKTGVPFNEEEYLQNLIQAEFENRIGAQSGRTMSPTPGQATTAPGATAPGWGPAKVVTP